MPWPTSGGDNPHTTADKFRKLRHISEQVETSRDLMRGWQSAGKLHIHADRLHLDQAELNLHLEVTQKFINDMLCLYAAQA